MTYSVVRRNKLLHIMKGNVSVYTPPNFILLNSKNNLQRLCDKFNEKDNDDIVDIIEWESQQKYKIK